MAKPAPRQTLTTIPLGGADRGRSASPAPHVKPHKVKELKNMIFSNPGVKSRLGWETQEETFEGEGSFPNAQSGGWDSDVYGRWIDYAKSDYGKVKLFAGGGLCTQGTGLQFANASTFAIALPSSESEFLGCLWFANNFLVYTENKLYEVDRAVSAVVFTGSGLDDMTQGGAALHARPRSYRVEIDGTGAPDTFRWSRDGGTTWRRSTVSIVSGAMNLDNELTVTFAATTGHTLTDRWDFSVDYDGTITEMVDFEDDLGVEYAPILDIVDRFGQLWVLSKNDRMFWSDVLKYEVENGTAVTEEGISKKFNEWQSVFHSGAIASATLEYEKKYIWNMRSVHYGGGSVNDLTNDLDTKYNTDYCYVRGNVDGLLNDGDNVLARQAGGGKKDREEFKSSALNFISLAFNAASGQKVVIVNKGSDRESEAFRAGDTVTISDGSNSETNVIRSVQRTNVDQTNFKMEDDLNNTYTTGASAKVTSENVHKVKINGTWDIDIASGDLRAYSWVAATLDTDYNLEEDPKNNDDVDGHFRVINTPLMKAADALRVNYTPVENPWAMGESGVLDIAPSKGNNLAMAEGPNQHEEEGADIIYIFKSNGDIHAVTGKPGPTGTLGSLDIKFIASGMRVRPNTIQVTREGMYFGVLDGIDFKVYFIQHGDRLVVKEQIADLTEDFNFDTDIPFDDSSYTFYERTAVMAGTMYVIVFPNSTSGIPETNGQIYMCQAFKEDTGEVKGRWATMDESTEDEYEDADSATVATDGAPMTLGFYLHDEHFCRVYHIRTGHDYAAATRYYEMAIYGWKAGAEEAKDKYLFTKDNGDATYTTLFDTEHFWAEILTGMIRMGNHVNVRSLLFEMDLVGGSAGDGIDFTCTVYKDLDYSTVILAETVTDRTDVETAQKIITELTDRHNGINFTCKYLQLRLRWDNIKYSARPAYVLFRNAAASVAPMSKRGQLSEET